MKTLKKMLTSFLILLAFTFSNNINALQGIGNADKEKTGSDRGYHGPDTGNQGNTKQVGNTNRKSPKVPIDGGLSILLLGAAAFGIKKLREK